MLSGSSISEDHLLRVAKGEITGEISVIIRGHNSDFNISDGFIDISEFGDLIYLSSAEKMNISSTDSNDVSGGTGLRSVLIQGVDNDGVAIQEVAPLDGTNNVLTIKDYLRVNFLIGLLVGSAGWNVGNITAIAETAATTQCIISATEGISQNSHYTIPMGKSFHAKQAEFNASKLTAGQVPTIEFKAYARSSVNNCWIQVFDKKMNTNVNDGLDLLIPLFTKLSERTDLRFRANTDENNTEVRSRLLGLLVNN